MYYPTTSIMPNTFYILNFIHANSAKKHFRSIHTKPKQWAKLFSVSILISWMFIKTLTKHTSNQKGVSTMIEKNDYYQAFQHHSKDD